MAPRIYDWAQTEKRATAVGMTGFAPATPWSRKRTRGLIIYSIIKWFCLLDSYVYYHKHTISYEKAPNAADGRNSVAIINDELV